jgi:hypothetical protein
MYKPATVRAPRVGLDLWVETNPAPKVRVVLSVIEAFETTWIPSAGG